MGKRIRYIVGYLLLTVGLTWTAQAQQARGHFLDDSLKIGMPTPYALILEAPRDHQWVVVDSLLSNGSFELADRTWLPSQIRNGQVYDSIVLQLRTFAIDTLLEYSPQLVGITQGQMKPYFVGRDSIGRHPMVRPPVGTPLPLVATATWQRLPKEWDLMRWAVIIFIVVATLGIAVAVLLSPLRRRWQRNRLEKKHRAFQHQWQDLLSRIHDQEVPLEIITAWKRYLESVDNKPYTKMTTRELVQGEKSMQPLEGSLKSFDRAIYGKRPGETLLEEAKPMYALVEERYQKRIKALEK